MYKSYPIQIAKRYYAKAGFRLDHASWNRVNKLVGERDSPTKFEARNHHEVNHVLNKVGCHVILVKGRLVIRFNDVKPKYIRKPIRWFVWIMVIFHIIVAIWAVSILILESSNGGT